MTDRLKRKSDYGEGPLARNGAEINGPDPAGSERQANAVPFDSVKRCRSATGDECRGIATLYRQKPVPLNLLPRSSSDQPADRPPGWHAAVAGAAGAGAWSEAASRAPQLHQQLLLQQQSAGWELQQQQQASSSAGWQLPQQQQQASSSTAGWLPQQLPPHQPQQQQQQQPSSTGWMPQPSLFSQLATSSMPVTAPSGTSWTAGGTGSSNFSAAADSSAGTAGGVAPGGGDPGDDGIMEEDEVAAGGMTHSNSAPDFHMLLSSSLSSGPRSWLQPREPFGGGSGGVGALVPYKGSEGDMLF